MYMMAKHLHLTAVALSVTLFLIRFLWAQKNPLILEKFWAKVLPHIIDTVLLGSAVWLCVIISQYPLVNGWLTFKVVGVVAYIVFGLIALKKAKTAPVKWLAFIAALLSLAMTAHVAISKQPMFF